jgi:hypothetical protein
VVLVELLAAGQGAPWDQLVHVGVAGVVADLLALDAATRSGEEMILRGCAWMSRKRIFSSSRCSARWACSRPVACPAPPRP